ncbi:MAG: 2-C-methyl-D-erythritol 2,4-cyclodiphosphate synthase [Kiritimatiellae bacterium]|nr:2-C-methyl-D-erythritol 2,4-cyclodiphosphate synthase [Kiritimatiellia bacterium]
MIRVGLGYDSHRFEEGRRLVLGRVEFPGERGLKGHSDADVLVHAIIDALLGAAGLGDIGSHFPDTDPKYAGADSMALLKRVVDELNDNGWRLGNVDATLVCEAPKIGPRKAEIVASLAAALACPVSVKGKTNEKMDDIGAGLGIAVYAVALLEK